MKLTHLLLLALSAFLSLGQSSGVGVHPGFTDVAGKLKRRQENPARDPFVTPDGCRAYADAASKRLDARIAEEAKNKGAAPR